jgi:hypothetical protein
MEQRLRKRFWRTAVTGFARRSWAQRRTKKDRISTAKGIETSRLKGTKGGVWARARDMRWK